MLIVLVGLWLYAIGQDKADRSDAELKAYNQRIEQIEATRQPDQDPETYLGEIPDLDPGLERLPGSVLVFAGGCQIMIALVAMGVTAARREAAWAAANNRDAADVPIV